MSLREFAVMCFKMFIASLMLGATCIMTLVILVKFGTVFLRVMGFS